MLVRFQRSRGTRGKTDDEDGESNVPVLSPNDGVSQKYFSKSTPGPSHVDLEGTEMGKLFDPLGGVNFYRKRE